MAADIALLSFYNVSEPVTGGMRRVNELLQALDPQRVELFQPGATHPLANTFRIRPDFGCRRMGINWGMFNYYWPPAAAQVRRRVAALQPTCLLLTSIWTWAPFARRGFNGPVVLDAQNVDAVAIAERFGHRHPFTRLVARQECQVIQRADRIIACSEVDRVGFMKAYGIDAGRIDVVPNGATLPSGADLHEGPTLAPALESRLAGSTVCLFIGGKLDYPPNAEGLRFISASLIPALKQLTTASYKFLVVGIPVPVTPLHPDIIPVGRVPTLDPYLRRADICLAPIFSGSGTRLKALDYLAWGKPVVATAKAVEGIACHHGEHAVLTDRHGFAEAVESLRLNPEMAQHCAANGRELVRLHYEWGAVRERWRESLEPWLAPKS